MTTMNDMAGGAVAVAPVAFLISRGAHVDDHCVQAPNGTRLAIGDRWLAPTDDRAMAATVEVQADGVKVFLSYRVDCWSAREWAAYAATPSIVSVLAAPPLAWFLIESHGLHARAPVLLDLDPATGRLLQPLLARPQSLDNTITLFGIAGDVIRCVKVGVALDGVWPMLAEAAAATPPCLPEQELLDTLRHQASLDTGVMFAEAMRRQLAPRAR